MQSSNTIPKTQAYILIGGTLLLVLCAGALLIGWRMGLLATADSGRQTAEVNIPGAPVVEPGVSAEVSSAPVDNAALLQRLEQCRPECAGVDLAGIDLRQNPLGLSGVKLQRANLSGANLPNHVLRGDLSGVNLSRANLHAADLKRANFSGANLPGARLTFAILSGANLTGANLEGANLEKVRYDKHTTWPAGFDPQAAGAIFVNFGQ